ncbi:uncharacterized protein LOC119616000 isoform X2 [Lucilia sericata]|uniref:uncharacterized protein LOC119616000 isoform X2 n=1 Tax=Lucilia sericata TaxID=13632 RepID=UPI0018A839B4|nr:uncharacterized protein LOC119616000 isoform X2 [Lucilia sericata]
MKVTFIMWIDTLKSTIQNYDDYFDFDPEISDEVSLNAVHKPNKLIVNGLTRSDIMTLTELPTVIETTECVTIQPMSPLPPLMQETLPGAQPQQPTGNAPQNNINNEDQNDKAKELRNLVQLLYIAQARVQLEAAEIKKAQAVANSAQQCLEEAANHVRTITAALQNSQQEVASAAIRAQTAQLQLAAHDQLLFAARQDVDALSSQMVGLQAAEGITQPKVTVDLTELLEKLKKPLQEAEKPTPVPTVLQIPTQTTNDHRMLQHFKEPDYQHFYYK